MVAPEDERVEDPWGYMDSLAQEFLPLKKWGFRESARRGSWPKVVSLWPGVIYDSEWCRVLLLWEGWEMYTGNSIRILYGRLHASDDRATMIWNGEECYCWHGLGGIAAAYDFLDGLSPQESASRKDFSRIIGQLRQSDLWQGLAGQRRDPELAVRMGAAVWEHYGLRLFELFDLRRPDLWEQYRQFVREVYDIKGRSPNIKPSPDKVC